MNIERPPFRFVTVEAKQKLSASFEFSQSICQDWEWTVGNAADLDKYIPHYKILKDDDEKFALMEIMIQATEDQTNSELFISYWQEINIS